MLSDQERSTLHEIQRQLVAEDPQFVQIFGNGGRDVPKPRTSDQVQRAYTVLQWIAVFSGVVMLLAGSPVGLLFFAAIALAFRSARRRDDATAPLP